MLGNIGLPELLVILVLALLFFGPNRLPALMGDLGRGVRKFKDGVSGGETKEKTRRKGK